MSNKTKIVISVNSVESAVQAQRAGVSQVILCAGDVDWGTTPSFGTIRMTRQLLGEAQLFVLVRPRVGDYLYSSLEQEVMLHDVKVARQLGADGVVFGCLTASGKLDMPLMHKLMNAVGSMEVVFSRAFDVCSVPDDTLADLMQLGVHRVLTSGLESQVTDALPRITEWNRQAEGRIRFLLTGGVTAENIVDIADQTQCREFHIQAPAATEGGMVYRNEKVLIDNVPTVHSFLHETVDTALIRGILDEADKINEKDEALEKMLREAKNKKKKGRKSEDDDDE